MKSAIGDIFLQLLQAREVSRGCATLNVTSAFDRNDIKTSRHRRRTKAWAKPSWTDDKQSLFAVWHLNANRKIPGRRGLAVVYIRVRFGSRENTVTRSSHGGRGTKCCKISILLFSEDNIQSKRRVIAHFCAQCDMWIAVNTYIMHRVSQLSWWLGSCFSSLFFFYRGCRCPARDFRHVRELIKQLYMDDVVMIDVR